MIRSREISPLAADVLSNPTSPELDRLARLALRALRAPTALVQVFLEDTALVLARAGVPDPAVRVVPRGSFGHRVVAHGPSADADALTGTWEAVALGARAALGFPVGVCGGDPIGALVILDPAPRLWTAEEVDTAREFAAAVSDELDRRDTHVRLRRAERYQAVLERSPEAILVHVDGVIRFANAAAVVLVGGREPEDLVGRPIDTFLTPPYLKEVEAGLVDPIPGTCCPPPVSEERLTRLDGSVRHVELAALAYLRESGPAVQVFLRDITDRRQAREALRAREAHLRLLVERIPALYWTTDDALRIDSWRAAALPPLGHGEGPIEAFFATSGDPAPILAHQRALAGESASAIVKWQRAEYEMRVEPLRDDAGHVTGTVGVAVDATLRRRSEAREREARELQTLGRVAGGVAHGVNNALAAIVGVASVLSVEPAFPGLEVILDASGRARALTSNLLGFARQGRYRTERVDLNALASDAAEWTLAHRRAVTLQRAEGLPVIEGDPDQLRNAVLNVCQNAVDATSEGGNIHITLFRRQIGASEDEHPNLHPGTYACLEVRDTGAGMPDDVRAQAVEPFFTTKEVGEGAGIGLSMAFGVARHHGGDLDIVSTSGAGTAVTFSFPAANDLLPAAPPPRSASSQPRPKVVLLVDDDEWVLYSSSRLLEVLGYEVVRALDGPTALEQFRQDPARFTFVLLDLRMPGMDGEEVLRNLLAIDADTRVIICTGFERDQVSQRIFASGHVGFLGKPFTFEELREQIREVTAVRAT